MVEQNQTVALLRQDKEYLSKQVNEITPRFNVLEEKLQQTTRQLDEVKLAREELYEKYLNSRCVYLGSLQVQFFKSNIDIFGCFSSLKGATIK